MTLNRQFVTIGSEVRWCDPLDKNEWCNVKCGADYKR